jgi:DNA-directed RNA polymerase specialized sigma subunit
VIPVTELLLLIRQAQSGNKNAMFKIVEFYMPLVIKYSKDENYQTDEDCMQYLITNLIVAVQKFEVLI